MKKKFEFIYNWFEKAGQVIVRFRWIAISVLVLILVAAVLGLPKIELDISTDDWFKEGEQLKQAQEDFERLFGNNEYAALFIEADDVFSPEILSMMRRLGNELLSEVEFAEEVISIADTTIFMNMDGEIVMQELVPEEIPDTSEEIEEIRRTAFSKPHLVNTFFSADSGATWLILKLFPFPEEDGFDVAPADRVGTKILDILAKPEYQDYSIKPTGMVIMTVEEMAYYQTETTKLVGIAVIVMLIVLGLFLRSLRGILIPVFSAVSSLLIVFGFMGHLGLKIIATLMALPMFLTLAISIGYSIHIFNIFKRHFLITGERKKAVYIAVRETGWPIFFTMMTTVGALMSFCFIALLPLRWLGLVSAALIFCAYLIVMILNPVLLSFGKDRNPKQIDDQDKVQWTDTYFSKMGGWVYKNALPVMIVFLLVLGFFIWGLTKVEIGSDLKQTYGEKIPFIKRIMEITESEIGYFYSYNITLKFKEPDKIKDPQILKAMETYTQGIQARTDVRYVTSYLHIVKDMNQLLNENDPRYYAIPDDRNIIEQTFTLYEEHGDREIYTWVTEDYSTLRIKVAVNDMNDARMREDIEYVKNTAAQLFPDAEYIITGMIPTMVVINTNITEGLIKSLFIALGVILLLLMVVFKSIKTGLIGMIPNITPVIIVGGTMGLLNIPLDFMTMTMLPMILGLAVDDTIHFITHANMEFNKLNDYRKAIKSTMSVTGRALFMTSFIIVAAFAIYFTADMQAQVNFGIFITLGISSALIADYLITPVCLKWLKPFGKRNHKEYLRRLQNIA